MSYQCRLLWAACCLGFFAFLLSGEFNCPLSAAYDSSMLSWGDIQVDSHDYPSYLRIVLRHSKTDLCQFSLTGQVPCSMYQDGHPLSRVDLVAAVCQALTADGHDVSRFNGHSFWIGAATTAAQVGVPDSVIQSLGRWKSSAFMTYVRTSPQQLTAISRRLVST